MTHVWNRFRRAPRRRDETWAERIALAARAQPARPSPSRTSPETREFFRKTFAKLSERCAGDDDGARPSVAVIRAALVAEGFEGEGLREAEAWFAAHSAAGARRLLEQAQVRDRGINFELRDSKGVTPMDHYAVKIAKAMVASGQNICSSNELADYVKALALSERRSGETDEQAFSRVFCENSARGLMFRQADAIAKRSEIDVCKSYPIDADDDDKDDDECDPMDELREKAAALRKRDPSLSEAQAFSKVYESNPALALRERRQSRGRLGVV